MDIEEAKSRAKALRDRRDALEVRLPIPEAPDDDEFRALYTTREDGVRIGPTLEVLEESFPDYARAIVEHRAEMRRRVAEVDEIQAELAELAPAIAAHESRHATRCVEASRALIQSGCTNESVIAVLAGDAGLKAKRSVGAYTLEERHELLKVALGEAYPAWVKAQPTNEEFELYDAAREDAEGFRRLRGALRAKGLKGAAFIREVARRQASPAKGRLSDEDALSLIEESI